jgi:hypothetical protein
MSRGTIADLRREMATKDDINRHDTKLTKFEEREIDKRLQLCRWNVPKPCEFKGSGRMPTAGQVF